MRAIQNLRAAIVNKPWLAYLVATLGGVVFAIQARQYAHFQTSFLDEGAFLYIGHRFLDGTGVSYGNLGPWGYYAPLSFLIPGLNQELFGPGLQAGRYFSIVVSLLMLVGLWVSARRLGGKWWAAAAVWAVALMPMQIKMYSLGMSQALAACFLTWALALTLGEKRPFWQVIAGSFVAGLTVMTRQNLVPLIPLLVGYIFWQHGRKAGRYAMLASLLPIVFVTIAYWPNILRWLSSFGAPPDTIAAVNGSLTPPFLTQLSAFFLGFRAQYFILMGAFTTLLIWPHRGQWKNKTDGKAGVFLAVLFFVLLVLHGWASLGYSQCTFCFAPYLAFFSNIALLLVIPAAFWLQHLTKSRQILIVAYLLFVSLGIGLATYDTFGDWLLSLPVPRISGGLYFGEWVTLWDYVGNKLNMDYFTARSILPPFFALVGGELTILAVFTGYRFFLRRKANPGYSFGSVVLGVFLLAGYIISPLMNGDYHQSGDCSRDVIANYEKIGQELADLIPAGSQVYWNVGSAVPLLYLPGVNLHLVQVYGEYSYRIGGSAGEVEKYGYWNEELARRWMAEADFIVIEEGPRANIPAPEAVLDLDSYTRTTLPPVNPCNIATRLFVYKRSP
jgi:hypothetical protein